jgi:hypothetical protein
MGDARYGRLSSTPFGRRVRWFFVIRLDIAPVPLGHISKCRRSTSGLPGFSITACAFRRGQIEEPPLLRFRFFPSAYCGCAVLSGVTIFRTIPLRHFAILGTHARNRFALAVFNASRLRIRALID